MYERRAKIGLRYFPCDKSSSYPGENGYWVVECPSLPGCISQGKTKEEAVQNIREAIEGYVLALQEDGLPIPPERFDAVLLAV
ncbi:MAG TPA: type II toxin-antitoxin system HicB family antitoxin [Candidatus Binatus sp.]|jgi:predicted RNase H-like HicB family nuclease|nr:type II toxin-antitoxin system HicB family antitoxin [Candidatus Binatus sp.]